MTGSKSPAIHVLGISGSPRPDGNTDTVVRAALESVEQLEGVTTTFFGLGGKLASYCTGCVQICHPGYGNTEKEAAATVPGALCRHDDAVKDALAEMAKADAIMIGSPVYFGNVPGPLKTLMDRSTAVIDVAENGRYSSPFEGKVGGAIAVGGARHGGQEATLQQIFTYFLLLQMIPLNFSEYGDQCHGVACVAALPGEIEQDDWPVPVVNVQTSALQQAKLYAEKLVRTTRKLQQSASADVVPAEGS